jgi:hypothetical protein
MPSTLDSIANIYLTGLTAWRENRGGGAVGMRSVINVIQNGAAKHNCSLYDECTKHARYSSISMPGPESYLWPKTGDPQMAVALDMAQQATENSLPDITGAATLYYAPGGIGATTKKFTKPDGTEVPFPDGWNQDKVEFTTEIANQLFFRER